MFLSFFFLSALSSVRYSGLGASSSGQAIHPLGGGGKLPRLRGIFTPETTCTKAPSLPVCVWGGWGRGGRGKLPRIQDKPVHRFGMFICTHCSLVHARVHVQRDNHSAHLFIKIVYMYFKARLSMYARHFSFRYSD